MFVCDLVYVDRSSKLLNFTAFATAIFVRIHYNIKTYDRLTIATQPIAVIIDDDDQRCYCDSDFDCVCQLSLLYRKKHKPSE